MLNAVFQICVYDVWGSKGWHYNFFFFSPIRKEAPLNQTVRKRSILESRVFRDAGIQGSWETNAVPYENLISCDSYAPFAIKGTWKRKGQV